MRILLPVVFIAVLSSGCLAEDLILPLETMAPAPPPAPVVIEIPSARVGDEVVYRRAYLGDEPMTWDVPEEKWRTRQTFRISGIDEITDFAARPVAAVVLDRMEEFLDDENPPHVHDARLYLDPHTRNVIRTDNNHSFAFGSSKELLTDGYLNPYPVDITQLPGIELQGRTVSSDSTRTFTREAVPRSPVSTTGGGGGGGSMALVGRTMYSSWNYHIATEFEEQAPWEPRERTLWVVGPERIDGADAMRVSVESGPWFRDLPTIERTTMWFRDGEAYPFRYVDENIAPQPGSQPKITRSLAIRESYTAGSGIVAWHSGDLGPIPVQERGTSSSAGPADGVQGSLPYPIEDGLRDGQQVPGLLLWRQANTGSLLVSAHFAPGSWDADERPSWKWQFAYGTPSGDGYVVSTERVDDVSKPLINDHGTIKTGSFDETAIRTTLLTFAELETLWDLHRSDRFKERPVNFVHWGFEVDAASTLPCVMGSTSSKHHEARRDFAMGYVGYTSTGSCLDASDVLEHSMVIVDMGAGIVVGLHERVDQMG